MNGKIEKDQLSPSFKEEIDGFNTQLNDLANLGFKENTSLSEEIDINNIVQTGFCSINSSMLNYPTMFINSNSCLLQTIASIDNLYPRQLAYDIFNPNIIVTRQCINGTWSGWKQLATIEKYTPTFLNGWQNSDKNVWQELTVYRIGNVGYVQGIILNKSNVTNDFITKIDDARFIPAKHFYGKIPFEGGIVREFIYDAAGNLYFTGGEITLNTEIPISFCLGVMQN